MPAVRRAASPLTRGKRIEVRGLGHGTATERTLTLPSPLARERRKLNNAHTVRTRLGDATASAHPASVLTAEVELIGYVNPEPRTTRAS